MNDSQVAPLALRRYPDMAVGKSVQFPDLTEMLSPPYKGRMYNTFIPNMLTEFSFYVEALGHTKEAIDEVIKYGFKPITSMNNWYPSHRGEPRKLTFYWYKNPKPEVEPPKANRQVWGTSTPFLAAGGCGFKIGEPPLHKASFHRYFTLLRMPVEVSAVQQRWLKKYNFQHLDTGLRASYYVNGWDPTVYNRNDELAYFGIPNEDWWRANGNVDREADDD